MKYLEQCIDQDKLMMKMRQRISGVWAKVAIYMDSLERYLMVP